MRKIIVVASSSICIFLLLMINSTTGLQCYSCVHLEGGEISNNDLERIVFGVIKGHKSCKSGKKPDKKLVQTCADTDPLADISCAKAFYVGTVSKVEYKATFRGCFATYENLTTTCDQQTILNLTQIAAATEIKDVLKLAGGYLGENTLGNFCSCDSDSCNKAPIMSMTSWVWGSLLLTLTLFSSQLSPNC